MSPLDPFAGVTTGNSSHLTQLPGQQMLHPHQYHQHQQQQHQQQQQMQQQEGYHQEFYEPHDGRYGQLVPPQSPYATASQPPMTPYQEFRGIQSAPTGLYASSERAVTPGMRTKYRASTRKPGYQSVAGGHRSSSDLPALFKSGGLELLRPGLAKEGGYLEVYPRGHRKPYLLEQLEVFLEQKLKISERMINQRDKQISSPTGELKLANIRAIASNLHLDAHRQCFEMFINAFNTYRPLLQRIKNQFEAALDGALKSEQDNILLRQQLMMAETEKVNAVDSARAESASAANNQRAELSRRLAEAESLMKAAELKAEQAINDARMAKQLAAEAMADANEMREQNKQLKQRMLDEASWSKRPLAEATGSVMVNPRTDAAGSAPDGASEGGSKPNEELGGKPE
mmetsp:Transcript_32157/g.61880  ORF Transcript_32157/g.61880 Transcript_32157/m.61880 type:complete len:400 (+) Transcript_32157:242-1441(+)